MKQSQHIENIGNLGFSAFQKKLPEGERIFVGYEPKIVEGIKAWDKAEGGGVRSFIVHI